MSFWVGDIYVSMPDDEEPPRPLTMADAYAALPERERIVKPAPPLELVLPESVRAAQRAADACAGLLLEKLAAKDAADRDWFGMYGLEVQTP